MSGDSLDNVPDLETYRSMLALAARIEDREKSIELFFLLSMGGRRGLRPGELAHFQPSWYDEERGVIEISTYDCECGLCRSYAKKMVKNGDPRPVETVLEEEYWQPKTDAGKRTIPLKTDREIQAVEEYIDCFGDADISYRTIHRRIKRFAELHDDLVREDFHPHTLRATAATHLAWADFAQPALEGLFGWGDRGYGNAYVRRTGVWVSREFDRLFRWTAEPMTLRGDPPTRRELREQADDLITVDTWTPAVDAPSAPAHRDAEEAYLDTENADITTYTSNVYGPVSAAFSRLLHGRQAWDQTRSGPFDVTAMVVFALGAVGLAIAASWGDTWPVVLGGMFGFGFAAGDVDGQCSDSLSLS